MDRRRRARPSVPGSTDCNDRCRDRTDRFAVVGRRARRRGGHECASCDRVVPDRGDDSGTCRAAVTGPVGEVSRRPVAFATAASTFEGSTPRLCAGENRSMGSRSGGRPRRVAGGPAGRRRHPDRGQRAGADLALVGPASVGPLGAVGLGSAVPECRGDEPAPPPKLETPGRRQATPSSASATSAIRMPGGTMGWYSTWPNARASGS